MENCSSTPLLAISEASGQKEECASYVTGTRYLLTSNLDAIVVSSVLFIAIATFTVLANCMIVIAVIRGYHRGIPAKQKQQQRWRTSALAALRSGVQRIRSTVSVNMYRTVTRPTGLEMKYSNGTQERNQFIGSSNDKDSADQHLDETSSLCVPVTQANTTVAAIQKRPSVITPLPSVETMFASATSAPPLSKTLPQKQRGRVNNSTDVIAYNDSSSTVNLSLPQTRHPLHENREFRTQIIAKERDKSPLAIFRDRQPRIKLGCDSNSIAIVLMTSMALTDAILGAAIMPLSVMEIMYNGHWPLAETEVGQLLCKLRHTLDMALSTTSIFHVTCMAADRYLAVCRPFLHKRLGMRVACVTILVCWLLPVAMITAFLLSNDTALGVLQCGEVALDQEFSQGAVKDLRNDGYVNGDFTQSQYSETSTLTKHDVTSGTGNETESLAESFFITTIPLLVSATSANERKIYGSSAEPSTTRKTALETPVINVCVFNLGKITQSIGCAISFFIPFLIIIALYIRIFVEMGQISKRQKKLTNTVVSKHKTRQNNQDTQDKTTNVKVQMRITPSPCPSRRGSNTDHVPNRPCGSTDRLKSSPAQKTSSKLRKVKAMWTIGLVVLCFSICWLPFSVYTLARTLNVNWTPQSHLIHMMLLWLAYLSSSFNPILYLGHVTVRAAIVDLFCGRRQVL